MTRICDITGSKPMRGSVIHRRGLAKKKGGVGRHVTKMVPRIFAPNLRRQRSWMPELKKFVRVRVTPRGRKTCNNHRAYKALKNLFAIDSRLQRLKNCIHRRRHARLFMNKGPYSDCRNKQHAAAMAEDMQAVLSKPAG